MRKRFHNGNWATFSEDRRYRYSLGRRVGDSSCRILFIMLNPSRADERRDDATIRRCVGFARDWGFGILDVVNLFALMSTDPRVLLEAEDPVGPANDAVIGDSLLESDTIVLAWGNHALFHRARVARVTSMARQRASLYCMGHTAKGAPRHPLRLAKSTALREF